MAARFSRLARGLDFWFRADGFYRAKFPGKVADRVKIRGKFLSVISAALVRSAFAGGELMAKGEVFGIIVKNNQIHAVLPMIPFVTF